MRNETMMLPVKCREGGSGDAASGTLGTVGGFIGDAKASQPTCGAGWSAVGRLMPPSQLVSFSLAAERLGEISSGEDGSGEDGSGDESGGEKA